MQPFPLTTVAAAWVICAASPEASILPDSNTMNHGQNDRKPWYLDVHVRKNHADGRKIGTDSLLRTKGTAKSMSLKLLLRSI